MSQIVAVTGATGFIGRAICRGLAGAGFQVRALVRSAKKAAALETITASLVPGSLEDTDSLDALVKDACAVVHCAGAVRGVSQEQFDRVNVGGVRRLLQVLESRKVPPRLLSLSSLAAREPALSFYAASKHKGEEVLISESRKVAWMALRPPAVYGPGDKELLPLFRAMAKGIAPVPGAAEARFSMLFVDDLAAAVLAWLRCDKAVKGVFTLEDGRAGGYDWSDVAGIVSRLCHRRVRILPVPSWVLDTPARLNRLGGRLLGYAPMLTPEKLRELRHPDWVCDSAGLQAELGWRPAVQLEEGLQKTPGWPGYRG